MSVEFDIDYGLGFETKLIGSEKRKGIGLSGEERKALGRLTRRRIVLAFCKMNLGFECEGFFSLRRFEICFFSNLTNGPVRSDSN